jgi:hypothetical protein
VVGTSTDSQNRNPESDLAWSAPFAPAHSIKKNEGEPDFVADLLEYLEYLPPEDFQNSNLHLLFFRYPPKADIKRGESLDVSS